MSEVLYRFKGGEGEFILGLPARDITLDDWEVFEQSMKDDLLVAASRKSGGLYEKVATVNKARKNEAHPPKKGKGRNRTTQVDPDSNVSGGQGTRTDSDVLQPGQAVPPTDEPLGEGATGFVQADTGGSAKYGAEKKGGK